MAVACPHCGQQMIDDGSLSGQVVGCPFCNKDFRMPPALPKRDGLHAKFNILHYLVAAGVGLFIGTFGGCSVGWRLMGLAAMAKNPDDFSMRLLGNIGGAFLYFGPFVGVSLALCLLWRYDLNRKRRH